MEGGSKLVREGRRNSGREEEEGKPGPEVCFHGGYKPRPVDTGELTLHCYLERLWPQETP